ncbi:MAG: response regulator [Opitutaceae bacterium]|jgi:DNA-binding NtrC family response regulator
MAKEATSSQDRERSLVLVVDDENALNTLLTVTLSDAFDIETATSAEEAELLMASRSYDAIVCDHMLPGEQGLDFLVRMSSRYPDTKRILLTGYINPDFLSRSIGVAKLSSCLLKPTKMEDLAAAVRKALTEA